MRKSNYLQLSENKDREAYNLLLNCRHCLKDQLNNFISDNRIKQYQHQKLIERVDYKNGFCYRLTDKGYKEFDRQLGKENMRYHSQSIAHDIMLSYKYIQIHKENENIIWKNEEDLKSIKRDMIKELKEQGNYERMEQLERMSVPDSLYINDGISIGYDVVTDNYSNMDIQLKEEFCNEVGASFQTDRI